MQKRIQLKLDVQKDTGDEKFFVAFSYIKVGTLFKAKLCEYFDFDIKKAFYADKGDLINFKEAYPDVTVPRDFLSQRDKLDPDKCYDEALNDKDIKILTVKDEKYPELLKEIPDFPLCLFYKGDIENINFNRCLAAVGSRAASNSAKIALSGLISGLNNTDVTIVSGLAYGIDATAHESAIKNNLKTIGVIGSGLDIIYPKQNKKLYEEILNGNGAIFSEYPLKTQPLAFNFPQRNRIVVGLSKGTLVAEARIKSGAMISANLTLEYNRELMCMPGAVNNPNTEGIYRLIKNGAGIVTETNDILDYLNWNIEISKEQNKIELNEIQKEIMNVLELEAKNFDEIINNTGRGVPEIMVALTELEIKGLIKQLNNKYYKC